MKKAALNAATKFVANLSNTLPSDTLKEFAISIPQAKEGTIASGDKFVAQKSEAVNLATEIAELGEELFCVEMEGAAVAHICENFGVDYIIIRTISDNANHDAHIDFQKFIETVAAVYSAGIVQAMV